MNHFYSVCLNVCVFIQCIYIKFFRPSTPPPGKCWFNFDDSRVHPINDTDLEKTFGGKSSAYMLFYRKSSLSRPHAGKIS